MSNDMTDEKKATAAAKRKATAERKKQWEADRKAEREKTINALRLVRDHPASTPSEKLRACELLDKLHA